MAIDLKQYERIRELIEELSAKEAFSDLRIDYLES